MTEPHEKQSRVKPADSCLDGCTPRHCRPGCSLQILAILMGTPGAVSAEECDYVLDLHQLLKQRRDAEQALRVFCDLRRRLEQKHYLAFYRLRQWLQNHITAEVSTLSGPPRNVRLRLTFYCIEAVRRGCLCEALRLGSLEKERPVLRFLFLPLQKTETAPTQLQQAAGA